jgi:hypothetical protein
VIAPAAPQGPLDPSTRTQSDASPVTAEGTPFADFNTPETFSVAKVFPDVPSYTAICPGSVETGTVILPSQGPLDPSTRTQSAASPVTAEGTPFADFNTPVTFSVAKVFPDVPSYTAICPGSVDSGTVILPSPPQGPLDPSTRTQSDASPATIDGTPLDAFTSPLPPNGSSAFPVIPLNSAICPSSTSDGPLMPKPALPAGFWVSSQSPTEPTNTSVIDSRGPSSRFLPPNRRFDPATIASSGNVTVSAVDTLAIVTN